MDRYLDYLADTTPEAWRSGWRPTPEQVAAWRRPAARKTWWRAVLAKLRIAAAAGEARQ